MLESFPQVGDDTGGESVYISTAPEPISNEMDSSCIFFSDTLIDEPKYDCDDYGYQEGQAGIQYHRYCTEDTEPITEFFSLRELPTIFCREIGSEEGYMGEYDRGFLIL